MSVVSGIISIKDNATATLRSVKQGVASFRSEVETTKQQLEETWDKKREARLDNSAAKKKADELKQKLEPLRKKVTTALAAKDAATSKVKKVATAVKSVGKMVAKPVVSIVVKGMQGIAAVGKAVTKMGAAAVAGVTSLVAGGTAIVGKLFSGSEAAAKEAMEAQTKLAQVMSNTMDATAKDMDSVMDVIREQESGGIISSGIQLEGAQELATYLEEVESLETILPTLNDMLAQQYGTSATAESAVNIATMLGKVMNGQTGALSRYGYTFTDAQERILKYGTEAERAATLAEVVGESVGGVNAALAETDVGRITQMTNAFGNVKQSVGETITSIKGKLAGAVMENMPAIQGLADSVMGTLSGVAERAMPMVSQVIQAGLPLLEKAITALGGVVERVLPVIEGVFNALDGGELSGFTGAISALVSGVKPIIPAFLQLAKSVGGSLKRVANGFTPLVPLVSEFAVSITGSLTTAVQGIMPAIEGVMSTVGRVLPVIMPVVANVTATIASLFQRVAPVVTGLVEIIGSAVSTLAPVFQTIFNGIASKVGTVIDFVSSKMGFIRDVFDTVMPVIADVFTSAWDVIGPVIDIAIGAFKLIFNVVQAVFPAIKKIVETVWAVLKPIVNTIGKALSGIGSAIGWLADKFGFGGDGDGADDDWAELSSSAIDELQSPTGEAAEATTPVLAAETVQPASAEVTAATGSAWEGAEPVIESASIEQADFDFDTSGWDFGSDAFAMPVSDFSSAGLATAQPVIEHQDNSITVTIPQLAGQVIIREEADIDKIGNAITSKVVAALQNKQAVPAPT